MSNTSNNDHPPWRPDFHGNQLASHPFIVLQLLCEMYYVLPVCLHSNDMDKRLILFDRVTVYPSIRELAGVASTSNLMRRHDALIWKTKYPASLLTVLAFVTEEKWTERKYIWTEELNLIGGHPVISAINTEYVQRIKMALAAKKTLSSLCVSRRYVSSQSCR